MYKMKITLFVFLILFLTISILPGCSCDEDSSAEALAKADDDDLPAVASVKVGDDDDNDYPPGDGFFWKEGLYVQYVDGGDPGASGTSIEIGQDGTLYVLAEKGGVVVLYTKEPGSSSWTQTRLDYLAFDCAMAMDEDGYLHVAVGAEDPDNDAPPDEKWKATTQLRYLTNTSGQWETTVVDIDIDIAQFVAIDTDENGFAHIAYLDDYNNNLKYATNKSGQWTTEAIFTEEEIGTGVGQDPRIAIDPWGNVHVIFHPMNSGFAEHGVYYGTNKNGAWEYESVAGSSISSALAVDDEGFVHIAHAVKMNQSNNYDLYYTTNQSGEWIHEMVANYYTCGWGSSIAVGQNGAVHIGFRIYQYTKGVGYATNENGYWEVVLISNDNRDGIESSIALDQNNTPYIAHNNYDDDTLKLATPASGSWTTEAIDAVGRCDGLLDGVETDKQYILFNRVLDDYPYLDIAEMGDEGNWSFDRIDALDCGWAFDLAVDNEGFGHVVFYDGNILKYSNNTSTQWTTANLWTNTDKDDFSIDTDNNGEIHIAFIDQRLWYMTDQNGSWEEELVDEDGGYSPVVEVDQNGYIHIVYSNNNLELSYATNQSGLWEITTVFNGNSNDIKATLDSMGYSHVVAYDWELNNLYYHSNKSGTWQKEAISDILADYDIYVDSQDRVSIVNDCQYYHLENGQWIGTTNCILPAGEKQGFRSIQIDDNDMAHGLVNYRGGLWYVVFPRDYQ